MPLSKAQSVPFLKDAGATHFARLIGCQSADCRIEPEKAGAFPHKIRRNDAIAVNNGYNIVGSRSLPRDGSESVGKSVSLTGAGNSHDHQVDLVLVATDPLEQALDQALIACLYDGCYNRGFPGCGQCGFESSPVDTRGDNAVDAKGCHKQI